MHEEFFRIFDDSNTKKTLDTKPTKDTKPSRRSRLSAHIRRGIWKSESDIVTSGLGESFTSYIEEEESDDVEQSHVLEHSSSAPIVDKTKTLFTFEDSDLIDKNNQPKSDVNSQVDAVHAKPRIKKRTSLPSLPDPPKGLQTKHRATLQTSVQTLSPIKDYETLKVKTQKDPSTSDDYLNMKCSDKENTHRDEERPTSDDYMNINDYVGCLPQEVDYENVGKIHQQGPPGKLNIKAPPNPCRNTGIRVQGNGGRVKPQTGKLPNTSNTKPIETENEVEVSSNSTETEEDIYKVPKQIIEEDIYKVPKQLIEEDIYKVPKDLIEEDIYKVPKQLIEEDIYKFPRSLLKEDASAQSANTKHRMIKSSASADAPRLCKPTPCGSNPAVQYDTPTSKPVEIKTPGSDNSTEEEDIYKVPRGVETGNEYENDVVYELPPAGRHPASKADDIHNGSVGERPVPLCRKNMPATGGDDKEQASDADYMNTGDLKPEDNDDYVNADVFKAENDDTSTRNEVFYTLCLYEVVDCLRQSGMPIFADICLKYNFDGKHFINVTAEDLKEKPYNLSRLHISRFLKILKGWRSDQALQEDEIYVVPPAPLRKTDNSNKCSRPSVALLHLSGPRPTPRLSKQVKMSTIDAPPEEKKDDITVQQKGDKNVTTPEQSSAHLGTFAKWRLNDGHDFFNFSSRQVCEFLHKASFTRLADVCMKHELTGADFRGKTAEDLKKRPFNMNWFHISKLFKLLNIH